MNGVQKTLYFSKRHDADLISLYHQIGRKAFVKVMKESLRVLVRVDYEPTFTKALNLSPMLLDGECDDDEDDNKSFCVVVSFSSEKDTDIAGLIAKVRARKLGAFIKNAMRLLLGPYYILGCLLQGDEKLNDAYKDRKLFFVNGGIPSYLVAQEKPSRKTSTKKKIPTKTKEVQIKEESLAVSEENKPVPESTYFEPEIPVFEDTSNYKIGSISESSSGYSEPVASGEGEVFSDDDILALLENM